jgi:CRP/FNR family transcriptional regulator, cyclic AMP receptor protein
MATGQPARGRGVCYGPARMPNAASGRFFAQLDPADAAALTGLGRSRIYPPKSVLFFEGDDAHEVLIVRDGQVKVSASGLDGREVVLDVLSTEDLLGELSAIDGGPRSATAIALTKTTVLVIEIERFRVFVAERPAVAVALLRAVTERLRGTSRRQVEFGTVDGLGRVCARLVNLMARYGRPGQAGVEITAPLSQQEIGAWAGLSREAVVKALHALRCLGWVQTEGRTITVVDPTAVRSRAATDLP